MNKENVIHIPYRIHVKKNKIMNAGERIELAKDHIE